MTTSSTLRNVRAAAIVAALIGTATAGLTGLTGLAGFAAEASGAASPGMPALRASQPPAPASAINWRFGVMLEAWRRVEKPNRPGPTLRVTPPLPLHWGESRPLEWVLYGYGADTLAQAADAERIMRPFARGRIGRPASSGEQPETRVEMLRTTLEPLDLQGVRPLKAGEAVVWQPVERACLSMTKPPAPDSADATLIRNAYRVWLDTNGVIAQELSRDHGAFFTWVRGT